MRDYERLCREFSPPHKSNLKCFYWSGPSSLSFLQWAPVKTEELHDDPLVVQFYEVISDEEERAIQLLAGEHLNRATIQDPATGKLVNADYRIQKTAWLTESEPLDVNRTIAKYNKKLTQITGLDADYAELVQVGNYGVAGQYEPHWDHQSYPGAENRWDPIEVTKLLEPCGNKKARDSGPRPYWPEGPEGPDDLGQIIKKARAWTFLYLFCAQRRSDTYVCQIKNEF